MLETVREFSAARRTEAGEDEEAVGRFLTWARDFGVAYHDWFFGSGPLSAWERIRAEQDNLVPALRHALARTDGPTIAALTAVLTALWSTGSNFTRLTTLAADTGPPLSHYHPEPEYVEVARAAAVLSTATLFMGYGPHVVRQLVTLRRLPRPRRTPWCAPSRSCWARSPRCCRPTTRCCAGSATASSRCRRYRRVRRHLRLGVRARHRPRARLGRRIVTALGPVDSPFLQVMGHARLGELCLRTEQGEAAYEHLKAALEALPRLGDEHDSIGVRSGLVLACLHRGDPDEAEYWLRQAEGHNAPLQDDFHSPGLGGRAEIALARGLTEVGLGLWRSAVEGMAEVGPVDGGDPFLDRWVLQIQSAAVTAHAHVGRLELVADVVDRLRQELRTMLDGPAGSPMEFRYGTALHALGMAGLASGDASAVRMIALAERLRVLRDYQPTMSAARARRAAENADRAA
ncbi:hypothetical protein SPURM210S_04155 [Streptomyces purpurascens]